jgi:predicted transcriptional regulator
MTKIYDVGMQNFMKMLRKNKFTYAKIAKIVHCDKTTVKRYCTIYKNV